MDDIIRVVWHGHVLRKDDNDWVKKCMNYEVIGVRLRDRPKKTWTMVTVRLSDPTNMQGRCYMDCRKYRKLVKDVV